MNQISETRQRKIAFIQALWHAEIVDRCRQGFVEELARRELPESMVEQWQVPGAFDIPLLARKLARTGRYGAVVAAGFVVDGGIYRHEFVASTVIDALMRVQLETGVPVVSAVLTPHHFQENEHHRRFFADHFIVKGREAADACLRIVDNLARVQAGEGALTMADPAVAIDGMAVAEGIPA